MNEDIDFVADVDYLVQGEWKLSFFCEDGGIIVELSNRMYDHRVFSGVGSNLYEAMADLKSQLPSPEWEFNS